MSSLSSIPNMIATISKGEHLEELRQYRKKLSWADQQMMLIHQEIKLQVDLLDHMPLKPPTEYGRKERETLRNVIDKNNQILSSLVDLIFLLDEKITGADAEQLVLLMIRWC
ncbi:hypothetical protein L2E82_10297 [Cichorium intybus]|uniref:Uncharacterized protein n=1 Tax=Cichorium intybus TaxID=13427 RepID=A0ACB9GB91_CICIN|nr:hypothetical protein L2E82_10297 [Cichorium intybus]